MTTRPRVLTIAGSDPSGGAGLQADLKTFQATGTYGMAAVTAVTVQDTTGVHAVHQVPADVVAAQIAALAADCPPHAVKTGMLGDDGAVRAVAAALEALVAPIVVDPVIVATSGDRLLSHVAEDSLRDLLCSRAALVTPNAAEAHVLTGRRVHDVRSAFEAGRALLELGAGAALVTGGDVEGRRVRDVLIERRADGGDVGHVFDGPRIGAGRTHGTGCTLSAAAAAGLAHGDSPLDACAFAIGIVRAALAVDPGVGRGARPLDHAALGAARTAVARAHSRPYSPA